MDLIKRFLEIADIQDNTLMDLAIMTDEGLVEWKHPMANTCNNCHSSTKLFTSVCIQMLAEEGRFTLQDKVAPMFPELHPEGMDPRWMDVTVEHVLLHVMGGDGYSGIEDVRLDDGNTDYLTILFSTPLPHEPGTHYQYSDMAFYLLSRIVEKHSGLRLDQFIRLRLGYTMHFKDFAIATCPQDHCFGGGAMYIRASDMVKMGFMISCGGVYEGTRILSEESLKVMKEKGYALHHHGGSLYIKTGSQGQGIALSDKHHLAAAWHRTCYQVKPELDRNDHLLAVLAQLEKEVFGED